MNSNDASPSEYGKLGSKMVNNLSSFHLTDHRGKKTRRKSITDSKCSNHPNHNAMTSADVHVLIKIISWRCSTHVQKQNKNKIHIKKSKSTFTKSCCSCSEKAL